MNEAAKRYFDEVALQLRRHGLEPLPPEDGRLPVNWRGTLLCHVATAGGLRYKVDNPVDGAADQMRNQVYGIARATAEYMAKMETAPQLKACGLEGDYRVLAEFNNVVLAGHPTKYGVQFATWEWVQDHTALWQGHYTDSYAAAKGDFATRSGLVAKERQFSDQQLAEVYRCIHETLDSEYPMTGERQKLLTQTAEQIQWAVPNLDELVQTSNEKELIQGQMDDPGMALT